MINERIESAKEIAKKAQLCALFDERIMEDKTCYDFTKKIIQISHDTEVLEYIRSGSYGHVFHGKNKSLDEYHVKIIPYPKKEEYGDVYDVTRPENAELKMNKILSELIISKQTPHINLPICTFYTNIDTFINPYMLNVVGKNNGKYKEFIDKENEGKYHDKVSVLISEWSNRGNLLDFLKKHCDNLSLNHWKSFFFQLLSVLATIHSKYPEFRHNDLKANNILVHKMPSGSKKIVYKIDDKKYNINDIGYQLRLSDFDFACIPGVVDNKKVALDWTREINITPDKNQYYDIHYFFNTLIKRGFCPEIMTSDKVPQEVKDFINRILPEKYRKTCEGIIHERGRLLVNDEYTTPKKILETDPLFEEYRKKISADTITNETSNQTWFSWIKSFIW